MWPRRRNNKRGFHRPSSNHHPLDQLWERGGWGGVGVCIFILILVHFVSIRETLGKKGYWYAKRCYNLQLI